ncbi:MULTISPECIES: fluoride efflux transporter CrcB [unclassified Streptomyces]|uniref:fluoride efflux transporter CrcB n=1 Tax=unclassified Streptomyces TaxID=2593676 RepID=UPI0016604511|nr:MULTISPECIES: fluoride efflux transporter CrcB [unclassified Streptomyces]MBD0709814.1 chromosome condensation protein CrcB [Streptomyces sp. CBMA291]MBD0717668.1 chromosome condensation protein CrcB [Streptomyces sp. CBMA370]
MDLRGSLPAVGVIAAGGVLGATARYAASLVWPTATDAFPWTTFTVNAAGCALLGVLMVLLTETMTAPHPLLRPFLGTGFCGGFTTFSTYGLDTQRLLAHGESGRAVLYLGGTLVTALLAVAAGVTATRTLAARTGGREVR